MRCHGALGNDVAHVEIVEVVAGIAQHNTLELRESWLLVGEEFVTQSFRAKTFVGIDGQRLQWVRTRGTALDTCFAELIEGTPLPFCLKEFEIDRAPPVEPEVFRATLIRPFHIDAYLRVVEIFVIEGETDHGEGQFAREEDIALGE